MTIAFVPVRCGSKSIPMKNIKLFCGQPLVYWMVKALQDAEGIDQIFIATDSEEIKSIVNGFGFDKVTVYDREHENAEDTSSSESVMLEFLHKNEFSDDDLFVLAQATSPLTETRDIDDALNLYRRSEVDSMLTCTRVKKFLWTDNGAPLNYDFTKRPRRQDFDGVLVENGAFYISTVGNVKEYQNRLSGKIAIYEMAEFKAVDIDELDDWLIAEKMMMKYLLSSRTGNNE